MKKLDVRVMAVVALVAFAVSLLLSSVGPLSDDRPMGRRLVGSLLVGIVGALSVGWTTRRQQSRRPSTVMLDERTAAQVDALLADGKKVAAVKAVRDATGAGLADAVAAVEARAAV